jgi:DNA-binding NarL/FixJ family response regulator
VEPQVSVDDLVATAFDFLDAVPHRRHGAAVSLPAAAAGHRVDMAVTDRGVVLVVAPATDSWSSTLTAREREVAAALARGLTNRQIARELFLSVATVKDHVHHILAKTGLPNRAAVAGRWRAAARD